ncbi:hypothetical protein NQ314_002279 [Rhamnusium bicolor]|uniref:PiggyBac transposable element-derived protein domain-containing protein n=1 Tax=Rhamnusium bicolor TaxID=1586634 RepID=A0AAV8ZRQ0_9CUCU|nr:hypothetical protein NQ314_002279 [Rhamnusium bicolor]
MGTYEKEQERLQCLLQECLSDEDNNKFFEPDGTSDEYEPESSEDFDSDLSYYDNQPPNKKNKVTKNFTSGVQHDDNDGLGPSTSTGITTHLQPFDTEQHIYKAIESVIRQMDSLSSSDEEENQNTNDCDYQWETVTGSHLKKISFNENSTGFRAELYETMYNKTPYDFYKLFVNDDIINLIVTETNRYAAQRIAKNVHPNARVKSWKPTNAEEIEKLLGTILWMGVCPYPQLQNYWLKDKIYNNYIRNIISRNRFQLLLQMLHFSDNSILSNDRLQKLTPLLDKLKDSFQDPITPSENVFIDETLVPFRGRLKFLQYIKNKRHKFGIKMFKLCLEKGYTYNFSVYCGKSKDEQMSVPSKIVLDLMGNLLDSGRTVYTDNWYTSVSLATELLKRDSVAAECKEGIVVQKWRDKREVLCLSTKHTDEMVNVPKRGQSISKPKIILEYNKCKAFIDLSDQVKAYNTSLRRSLKWYRKLALELLTGTSLVNAHSAHQEIANEKMSITKYREEVIKELLKDREDSILKNVVPEQPAHVLENVGRTNRRRCTTCYANMSKQLGSKEAARKTAQSSLKCSECNKHYCLSCFF